MTVGDRRRVRRRDGRHRHQRPRHRLKGEGIGLAVMTELPMVIINVQRGGPSTGLPTKTEQADLFQAMFGRNGECPMPVIAASQPGRLLRRGPGSLADRRPLHDAGHAADRRLHRQRLRAVADSRRRRRCRRSRSSIPARSDERRHVPALQARRAAGPALGHSRHAGLEHRIGGLEKQDITGNVSYEPANHEHMVDTRAKKVANIANDIPLQDGRRPGKRRPAGDQLGRHLRRVRHGRARRASARALGGPLPTCAT